MNFSATFEQNFFNSLFYFAFNLSFLKNGICFKKQINHYATWIEFLYLAS